MVSADEVFTITQNVFATMLDSEVSPSDPQRTSEMSDVVTGCIRICGGWEGSIWVQTDGVLASLAASKMLAIAEESVQLADRIDTIAELTNMIGGNIKSLMPSPSTLSLPTVMPELCDGRDAGEIADHELTFDCNGHALRVILCSAEVPPTE